MENQPRKRLKIRFLRQSLAYGQTLLSSVVTKGFRTNIRIYQFLPKYGNIRILALNGRKFLKKPCDTVSVGEYNKVIWYYN